MLLSPQQALSEGADLWILSDHRNSHWYSRIDWLINFQLSFVELHKSQTMPLWTRQYLNESQFSLPEPNLKAQQILIPTQNWLPNQWICIIPFQDSIQNWIDVSHQVWIQLQKPQLRVFIPPTIQKGEWKTYWKSLEPHFDPALIMDQFSGL